MYITPENGDTFTIAGVTGTYTVSSVSWATTKRATLTLSTSLASSPADQADVTFTTNRGSITGLSHGEVLLLQVEIIIYINLLAVIGLE